MVVFLDTYNQQRRNSLCRADRYCILYIFKDLFPDKIRQIFASAINKQKNSGGAL